MARLEMLALPGKFDTNSSAFAVPSLMVGTTASMYPPKFRLEDTWQVRAVESRMDLNHATASPPA